jgi:hypothetical protein
VTARAALVVAAWCVAGCVRGGGEPRAAAQVDPRKHEITALATQIRQWRLEAGLAVEPSASSLLATRGRSVRAVRAQTLCAAAAPACAPMCELAEAICENAESICAIAAELAPDAWAADKCHRAKASCRDARQRCCGCQDDAP